MLILAMYFYYLLILCTNCTLIVLLVLYPATNISVVFVCLAMHFHSVSNMDVQRQLDTLLRQGHIPSYESCSKWSKWLHFLGLKIPRVAASHHWAHRASALETSGYFLFWRSASLNQDKMFCVALPDFPNVSFPTKVYGKK